MEFDHKVSYDGKKNIKLEIMSSNSASNNKDNYNYNNSDIDIAIDDIASDSNNETKSRATLSSPQMELVSVLTKYFILVAFAALTTITSSIALALVILLMHEKYAIYLYHLLLLLEGFFNGISLYLQFPFNDRYYHKLFNFCQKRISTYFGDKLIANQHESNK